VNWEESGEEVKMLFVNAAALEGKSGGTFSSPVYQVTRSAEDASTATLTIKEGETYNSAADLFFAAVYPASIVTVDNSASSLADAVKYNFPATQVYKGDGKIGFAPMLGPNPGFCTSPPDLSLPQSFTFGNACALLEITVPYTEMTSVRSITVSSDLRMNGEIEIEELECFCFKNPSNPGDGENQVTLDCYSLDNANVAIPEGSSKTFYVSIVPRESTNSAPYLKYLQIDVTDGTTTKTMRTKTFEGTKTSGIEIKPNTIYPIAFVKNYTPTSKLNIKVSSADIATLKSIKVVTDQNINGESKELVYSVPQAQQTPAEDGTDYSIEIPSQTYAYYQIYLSADGSTYKEAMASKVAVGAVSADVAIDYEKNAVQLWENSPYFATEKIKPEEENTTYSWGYDKVNDSYYKGTNYEKDALGNDIIPAAYDVATLEWGSAWRMPTKDEFSALIDGRNITYKTDEPYGFYIQGDDGYSTIFFPTGSLDYFNENSGQCLFWTSTPYNENNAYCLHLEFRSGEGPKTFVGENGRDEGWFVYAVLR